MPKPEPNFKIGTPLRDQREINGVVDSWEPSKYASPDTYVCKWESGPKTVVTESKIRIYVKLFTHYKRSLKLKQESKSANETTK